MKISLLCLVFLVLSAVSGCSKKEVVHERTAVMMGTFVSVISDDVRAAGIVFDEISRAESLLSKYDGKSELSRLNSSGRTPVGPDLMYLLTKAKEMWFATDGAFDVTVAPLMDIWGFTKKEFRIPPDSEIKAALNLVGMNKLIFHPSENVIEFGFPGMKIDLGGAAKGYAVDRAARKLEEAGVKSCLINAGGQIYCLGTNAGKPWKVAIKNPRGSDMSGYLELSDQAVATSGDYEQFFVADSKRYSHIMDPKTGRPCESGVISATVIAPDGLTADLLATSIVVLGREKGEELMKRFPDCKARILAQ